jgi:hypothetical protein
VELVGWDGGSGAVFVSFVMFAWMVEGDGSVICGSVLEGVFRLVDLVGDMVG